MYYYIYAKIQYYITIYNIVFKWSHKNKIGKHQGVSQTRWVKNKIKKTPTSLRAKNIKQNVYSDNLNPAFTVECKIFWQ